jgi:F-type H+-transporting ATPase subunit gamma
MKSLIELSAELDATNTVVNLTNVFESLASMKIAQTKDQVLQSTDYFKALWDIYRQIRVDSLFHFGRRTGKYKVSDKQLIVAITGEGGFSGDIDQRLIEQVLSDYDEALHDIIVVGHHGAVYFAQSGISFKKYYKLPENLKSINTTAIIAEVQKYRTTVVYYQSYQSLHTQDIRKIELAQMVEEEGKKSGKLQKGDVISEATYIFEPSTFEVVDHLERSMLQIALSQVILESRLAQYASRFKAMSMARTRSEEVFQDLTTSFNRTKRLVKDERLKEIMNGMRVQEAGI